MWPLRYSWDLFQSTKPEDIGTLEMEVERIKRRISCHQKRRKLG
jgi:hypothetical protein